MIIFNINSTRSLTIAKDEKIYVGDNNVTPFTVELPDTIGGRPIAEYDCEMRFYLTDKQYISYNVDTSTGKFKGFITSEFTDEARTLKVIFKFTRNGEDVGSTDVEELTVYPSLAGEPKPAPTPGANLDEFIGGKMASVTCNLEAIPDFAFSGKTDLEEVNIPNATYIGKFAFSSNAAGSSISGSGSGSEGDEDEEQGEDDLVFNNKKLRTVNMSSATHIDLGAFADDVNLEINELPEGLVVIGNRAFNNCPKVQLIKLPANITYIGDNALPFQENLEIDELPDSLTYMGGGNSYEELCSYVEQNCELENGVADYANVRKLVFNIDLLTGGNYRGDRGIFLSDRDDIVKVIIPPGVTKIPPYAFKGLNSLTEIAMPNSVKRFEIGCFQGAINLKTLFLHSGIEYIGERAFAYCHKLESLTIPDSVKTLGDECFYECNDLQALELGSGVTSIGYRAFGDCNSLTSLTIPDSVSIIYYSAFYECYNLQTLELGSGVTNICSGAFAYCHKLESLTIPDSVIFIGDRVFLECYELKSVDLTSYENPEQILEIESRSVFEHHNSDIKFIVKNEEMKTAFINTTNWAQYADYFVTEEEYNNA